MLGLSGSGVMAQKSDPVRQVRQSELNAAMEREDVLIAIATECKGEVLRLDSSVVVLKDAKRIMEKNAKRNKRWKEIWRMGFFVAVVYGTLKAF